MATDLYKTIKITPKRQSKPPVSQKAYRGFSTVNPDNNSFQQFDVSLIKQNFIKREHLSKILIKTYTLFQYYNNNYRPIYHVENYLLYLAKLIHRF